MSSTGDNAARRAQVQAALTAFTDTPLPEAAVKLLDALGYTSEKTADFGSSADSLLGSIEQFKPELGPINRDKIKADRWKSCAFLFQLTNDEIPSLAAGQSSLGADSKLARGQIESFVFLAIELQGENWSRTDLAAIARELNRRFPMPAIVIFRHGELLSLVVIDRRANLKDAAKDVIDSRITVIKDVRIANPHRAHLDILAGLALENLGEKRCPTNFRELYDAWIVALSTQALNKRFYQELANWYFWALTQAQFPKDAPKDADGRDSLSLIRLITRIIFCWFLKEKGLLPKALFDPRIATLLGDYNPTESTYYKAILQNLFFATLNQEMDKRVFRKTGQNFMAHNLYRYRSLMKNPDEVLKLLAGIPFMNGGLFECLDKTLGTKENPTYARIDGFSDRDDNPLKIPNELFFGEERIVDLSGAYGDNKFKSAKVAGLIHILNRYKFTVAENTPIEEEVALDPELLGRVFENLLAAYNPETGATARKQTGSFYTPREIVNYMVDESLIASLKTKLEAAYHISAPSPLAGEGRGEGETSARLRHLFAYNDQPHQFATAEVDTLIEAIDHLKILDPACGSGAFPMGMLHKMVFVLGKLDPHNQRWKARQIAKANEIPDATIRERALDDIEQTFASNELDYGRKLYLIENCIYGVDIQPIAVQISKLRLFISLVVEQKIDPQADNLGIRPLPNLETKFAAANALININRPGQQLLRNLDIDVKEAELRNVRERHFLARTPATKAKCREQDATLRAEIAELLKSDGWNTATACALAEWNPYDQNASAGFFDSEWMFGITDGFDICIGNPPYGANIDSFIVLFERLYPNTTKAFKDIYKLFIELALVKLLRARGLLCYITPNTLLRQPRYKDARSFLSRYCVHQVLDFGLGVFEQVVPTCVFLVEKHYVCDNKVRYVDLTESGHFTLDLSAEKLEFIPQVQLLDLSHMAVGTSGVIPGGGSLVPLGDVLELKDAGINYQRVNVGLGEKGKSDLGQRLLYEGQRESDEDVEYWKGEDISKFYISPTTSRFVRTSTTTFLLANERVILNREYFSRTPKLIWRQTASCLIATVDDKGVWFGRSIQGATVRHNFRHLDLYFLAGVLNSAYLRYVYNRRVQEHGRIFPQVKFDNIKPMPLVVVAKSEQKKIIQLVREAVSAKRTNPVVDISDLESQIDLEVYRLYGLTPEEIKNVEESAPLDKPRKQTTQEIDSNP